MIVHQMAESRDSFVRWQGAAIDQMSYITNMHLTLATACLGFDLTFGLSNAHLYRPGKISIVLSCIILSASIASGMLCRFNRLKDFRETAQIAREREEMENKGLPKKRIDDKLHDMRVRNQKRGKHSYWLLLIQSVTFYSGVALAGIALINTYWERF